MTREEKFVTAAYLVFLGLVLLYVVLHSLRLSRLQREVAELAEMVRTKGRT